MARNIPVRAAPTELGRVTGVVVAINMALPAELARFPALEMIIRSREHQRTPRREARWRQPDGSWPKLESSI